MRKLTKEKANKILVEVAKKHHTTVEEVKREIRLAMVVGMCNQSPEVQKKWAEIPHNGDTLTPEELLIYLSGQVKL